MRWSGETLEQREHRLSKGIECFAWFPRKMHDGCWVWLETYWCALWFGINGRRWWVSALTKEDCLQYVRPPCAPAPKK